MSRVIPTGEQSFITLRRNNYFYIDKTKFISNWWRSGDPVTLITRPRRFGKTLMLDTVKTFFSPEFAEQSEIFSGLEIFNNENFKKIQGTIPVIFISFADIKESSYEDTVSSIKELLSSIYRYFKRILDISLFSDWDKDLFASMNNDMSDQAVKRSIRNLAECLTYKFNNKPIILLDEYDSPLQEAWIKGYWDELVEFLRGFFNSTFKTNPYLERALITGITRVSKESIFSDMNNLEVVTTTSERYADCFGFTESEVFAAMDEYSLTDKEKVKEWYDGFSFGSKKEIYNPWSIINYLQKKKFKAYWANNSSNAIINSLISKSDEYVKEKIKNLIQGKSVTTILDEEVVFSQLYNDSNAIWSFLMASGYVKPLYYNDETNEYEIAFTNYEVHFLMEQLISLWFNKPSVSGVKFREALLSNNLKYMNLLLQDIAENTFSFFDIGKQEPERFYHAFVLGLIVDLKGRYEINSNRESGLGRYDVVMIPKSHEDHAIVIEFKVMGSNNEKSLEETCANALRQIKEKHYINVFRDRGINVNNIYAYGFAFKGKEVLICGDSEIDF